MKIATYNVRNLYDAGTFIDDRGTEPVKEGHFKERIAYFIQKFKTLDLDIICLQEIGGEKAVTTIGDALGYDYFFAKPNKRGIRMAVLYKKELANSITCESISLGELHIPPIQERGDTDTLKPIAQRRDILEITLTTPEKVISINTFHLKSNLPQYLDGDDEEFDSESHIQAKFRCILYKTMELCALKKHANRRIGEGKEVIFLGDYNENNTASMMDILYSAQTDELRLTDTLSLYQGDKTTHMHRGNKLTFDTIIVSAGLLDTVKEIHIENSDLRDLSMLPLDTVTIESDHALVWMEMGDR